jgi:hypothetical protein
MNELNFPTSVQVVYVWAEERILKNGHGIEAYTIVRRYADDEGTHTCRSNVTSDAMAEIESKLAARGWVPTGDTWWAMDPNSPEDLSRVFERPTL